MLTSGLCWDSPNQSPSPSIHSAPLLESSPSGLTVCLDGNQWIFFFSPHPHSLCLSKPPPTCLISTHGCCGFHLKFLPAIATPALQMKTWAWSQAALCRHRCLTVLAYTCGNSVLCNQSLQVFEHQDLHSAFNRIFQPKKNVLFALQISVALYLTAAPQTLTHVIYLCTFVVLNSF